MAYRFTIYLAKAGWVVRFVKAGWVVRFLFPFDWPDCPGEDDPPATSALRSHNTGERDLPQPQRRFLFLSSQ